MKELFARRWFRVILAIVALIGTAAVGRYQRLTGPTWEIPVNESIGGAAVSGELPRSHPGPGGQLVKLEAGPEVSGAILWRRYPTNDPWTRLPMTAGDGALAAELPHQPPAAKLEYSVRLRSGDDELVLPATGTAVIRFRGAVPAWVLIVHILLMFISLAFVLRAALGSLLGESEVRRLIPWVLGLMIPGGLMFGPIVQKYAFGAYWTGWPLGGDWTDNKTLVMVMVWVVAYFLCRWCPRFQRPAVLVATVVMRGVYLIPHSSHGSELDWEQYEQTPAAASAADVP